MNRRHYALLLLFVGLLQMTGDLAGLKKLKGFGAATLTSPAPRVFCAVGGLEKTATPIAQRE